MGRKCSSELERRNWTQLYWGCFNAVLSFLHRKCQSVTGSEWIAERLWTFRTPQILSCTFPLVSAAGGMRGFEEAPSRVNQLLSETKKSKTKTKALSPGMPQEVLWCPAPSPVLLFLALLSVLFLGHFCLPFYSLNFFAFCFSNCVVDTLVIIT